MIKLILGITLGLLLAHTETGIYLANLMISYLSV